MWYDTDSKAPDWSPALRHLRKVDPVLRDAIKAVGPCSLAPRNDPFIALCSSIFAQQLSTTIAQVLFARFQKLFPRGKPTPAGLLKQTDAQLRTAGLSKQKMAYLRDLAKHFDKRLIPVQRFPKMDDQQIIDALVAVHGVGRWTAEMFLIFVLNRPDLLPVDDLGLKMNIKRAYALPEPPTRQKMIEIAEPWRPWRTIATWYLWRSGSLVEPAKPARKPKS